MELHVNSVTGYSSPVGVKILSEVRFEDPVGSLSSAKRISCTTAPVNRVIDFRCNDPR